MEERQGGKDLKEIVQIMYASVTVRLRIPCGKSHQLLEELGEFNKQHREHLALNMIGSLHPHPEEGFDDVVVEYALSDNDTFRTFLRLFSESKKLQLAPFEK